MRWVVPRPYDVLSCLLYLTSSHLVPAFRLFLPPISFCTPSISSCLPSLGNLWATYTLGLQQLTLCSPLLLGVARLHKHGLFPVLVAALALFLSPISCDLLDIVNLGLLGHRIRLVGGGSGTETAGGAHGYGCGYGYGHMVSTGRLPPSSRTAVTMFLYYLHGVERMLCPRMHVFSMPIPCLVRARPCPSLHGCYG